MKWEFNANYPSVDDLRKKAKSRIPNFAFEYLDGGCNEDVNLYKNTAEVREIELVPYYLNEYKGSSMQTELFGHVYSCLCVGTRQALLQGWLLCVGFVFLANVPDLVPWTEYSCTVVGYNFS